MVVSTITPPLRCIHLLRVSDREYGCINATNEWSTPGFRALGLTKIMSLKNSSIIYLQGTNACL